MKKSVKMVVCVAIVLVAAMLAGSLYAFFHNVKLELSLSGEQELVLEFGEAFRDPGAQALFVRDFLGSWSKEVPVECSGTVDDGILGSYELTYTAQKGKLIATAKRTVHIVDTTPPVISLVSDPEGFTFPNETYQEEGFSAVDLHDGDVTQLVKVERDRAKILYIAQDAAGNEARAVRFIRYDDPVAPELELVGEDLIEAYAGIGLEDPGCIATDNCDGDITNRIKISGDVDENTVGEYTRVYTVKDDHGNEVSVSRQVRIKPLPVNPPANPNGKVICLTFDDGPSNHTNRLLDILAKYNVKATFFVVSTGAASLMQRMAQEGHTVAIHSLTHRFEQIYASEEAYFEDLYAMQSLIASHTGQYPTMVRFPGGSSNSVSKNYNPGIMTRLAKALGERGFTYFDWNVDSNDAGGASSAEEVFQNVIRGIQRNDYSIVLQHDTMHFSVDAVERIIIWGLENGYTFYALNPNSPGSHHGIVN